MQLAQDFLVQKKTLLADIERTLEVLKHSASEATLVTDPAQSQRVCEGMLNYPAIVEATLADDFGLVLGRVERQERVSRIYDGVVEYFLGPRGTFVMPLFHPAKIEPVGRIQVQIDNRIAFEHFIQRAMLRVVAGILANMLLAFILLSIFHRMLTRPLERMAFHYAAIDLDRPGAWDYDVEMRHREDELGLIGLTINHMLTRIRAMVGELHQDRQRLRDTVQRQRASTANKQGKSSSNDERPAHGEDENQA